MRLRNRVLPPAPAHPLLALLATLGLPALAAGQPCADWQVVDSPDPAASSILRDIAAAGPDDVWVVGDYFDGARIAQFSMRWDGARWTVHDIPVRSALGSGHLWAVDALGPDIVWAAGDQQHPDAFGYFGTHPLVVRWDGAAWRHVEVPALGSGASGDFVNDLKIIGPDAIWFVGEGYPISAEPQPSLALRWDGSGFEVVPTPRVNTFTGPGSFGSGDGLRAIDGVAPDDLWAVGAAGDGDPIRTDSQILHWDGHAWEHRPGPVAGLWHSLDAVVAIASDDVWAGGEYFDGTNYHGLALHWDGASWTRVPIPGGVKDFVAFATDEVLAVGDGVMRWDGASWSVVETFPAVLGPALQGADATGSACEVWAAGRDLRGLELSTLVVHRPAATCRADLTGEGELDFFDFLAFQNLFAAGDMRADFTGDGALDFFDFLAFQNEFAAGCP
ncbi:MAG: GC-type dockerin domain-anchored protein [Phycisphaerales bacterium JB039]